MSIPESAAPDWLYWLESCESTNSWAINHLSQLRHGDVVYTPQQTVGRGQHGRRWYAPPGGLTASFILDNLSANQLTGLSLVAGLAVIYSIEDLVPSLKDQLQLKWTNDVIAQDCKLAGILCEATSNSRATRVVIGVGLTCQVDFTQTGLTAAELGDPISLHQLCPEIALPEELTLLERLRHYLGQASALIAQSSPQNSGIAAFLPDLRQRDWLLDRQIRLQISLATSSQTGLRADQADPDLVVGQAAGIDDWGRLLIRQADGVRAFASGRVVNWV